MAWFLHLIVRTGMTIPAAWPHAGRASDGPDACARLGRTWGAGSTVVRVRAAGVLSRQSVEVLSVLGLTEPYLRRALTTGQAYGAGQGHEPTLRVYIRPDCEVRLDVWTYLEA